VHFYKAAGIVARAVVIFATRYAEKATMMARGEKNVQRRKELERIAETCRRVPAKPPRNLHEAIQFVRFTHLALSIEAYDGQAVSMGRMDQYLQPFYEADIKSGTIDRERAIELIEMLWIKTNDLVPIYDSVAGMYFEGLLTTQAVTIGGINKDGVDSTNDMTYVILEATKNTALPLPNVHIRIHPKSPLRLMKEIAATVASGANNIAMFNDDVIVRSWQRQKVPIEEARNYSTVGCVELAPFGTSFTSSDAALFNLAMCLELALNKGESVQLGTKFGVETADPLAFHSMDEVVEAFREQVSYLVGLMAEGSKCFETAIMELMPSPLLSLCVEDCFEAGRDITTGSARYNFTGVQGVGMADVADSLAAMDRLVFAQKRVSMPDLLDALRHGFEGKEPLRQLLLNKGPKYGNDDKLADKYAHLVARIYSEEVEKHKNIRGGSFIAGMYSVTSHVPFGYFTGALPSGRLATTPLSNGCSPAIGAPSKGLTAALSSVASIDYTTYANGVAFTLSLEPGFVSGGQGLDSLVNLLRSYVELGGMHIQFNMMDPQILRDAQTNPSEYRNLLVRVAGYSACFVDLSQDVQNDVIGRFQRSC
jgi:formate C-acetyltransferase